MPRIRRGTWVKVEGKVGIIAELQTMPDGKMVAQVHLTDPETGDTVGEKIVPVGALDFNVNFADLPAARQATADMDYATARFPDLKAKAQTP